MDVLESQINANDPQFKANATHNRQLVQQLREHLKIARQGGGEKYQQRQREQGKLFVRDRIEQLLDHGSPFLELSPLAALGVYEDDTPAAGIVTGMLPSKLMVVLICTVSLMATGTDALTGTVALNGTLIVVFPSGVVIGIWMT